MEQLPKTRAISKANSLAFDANRKRSIVNRANRAVCVSFLRKCCHPLHTWAYGSSKQLPTTGANCYRLEFHPTGSSNSRKNNNKGHFSERQISTQRMTFSLFKLKCKLNKRRAFPRQRVELLSLRHCLYFENLIQ